MVNEVVEIAVIGAGSAGLVAATTAKRLGAKVTLIESHKTGGECLHTGCIPSKTFIHSARLYHEMKTSDRYGLPVLTGSLRFESVMDHVHSVVESIYRHESPEALAEIGLTLVQGAPIFSSPSTLEVNGKSIHADRIIICTGSSPLILPIDGLDNVPFITNETVWDLRSLPERMLIVGGGPISIEMAQSFSRFGTRVTVVELLDRILPNEDEDISAEVTGLLSREGVRFITGAKVTRVEQKSRGTAVVVEKDGMAEKISTDALFLSTGRSPNIEGLGLENIGVRASRRGIEVDEYLQTSAGNIYACGDVVGPYRFTHTAGYQADVAVKNALYGNNLKNDLSVLPWVTFSEPEVARVGMTETEARQKLGNITVLRVAADSIDRSKTESKEEGILKIILDSQDRIVGAHAFAAHAGEYIHEIAFAMQNNLDIGAVGRLIHAYPTYAEIVRKAATRYLRTREKARATHV
jgi:pyruvate/2-oxoglutarate dehydrogenase complex dihydrolipoamide dehydrogenase (E3) component